MKKQQSSPLSEEGLRIYKEQYFRGIRQIQVQQVQHAKPLYEIHTRDGFVLEVKGRMRWSSKHAIKSAFIEQVWQYRFTTMEQYFTPEYQTAVKNNKHQRYQLYRDAQWQVLEDLIKDGEITIHEIQPNYRP